MQLPADYKERVYAGVLGKIIGVYLGRAVEGLTYQQIMRDFGEIDRYLNHKVGRPLITPDDDITGTFTFIRALPDNGNRKGLRADQIGDTWLNYFIQGRSVISWAGMGNSTEHTAYLRLKNGIRAPESGSIAQNGKVVAEQIGSQIFIDGWGLVAPGDPEQAAAFARRAASVSHDGEAIYGAQVVAVMEALAFVESDLSTLQDAALRLIPSDSIIYKMINEIREWHARYPDWRETRALIEKHYGYDLYGGNCHIVPNHALIHLGLLYGQDQFQRSLMITNTAGWDTDCNSGNVGCILGIKNGLRSINESTTDFRGPVADQMIFLTSDAGGAIRDAANEAVTLINIQNQLSGKPAWFPKGNARFHFSFPGSVQGFQTLHSGGANVSLSNPQGNGLEIEFSGLKPNQSIQITTPTHFQPDIDDQKFYILMGSPTIHSGQKIKAHILASASNRTNMDCALMLDYYDANDQPVHMVSSAQSLQPGQTNCLEWEIPDTNGLPIFRVGLQIATEEGNLDGQLTLLDLDWKGAPNMTLHHHIGKGHFWAWAWVNATSFFRVIHEGELRMTQEQDTGMLIYGGREWQDYSVEADLSPHMIKDFGLACYVQGLRRYIGLRVDRSGKVEVIRQYDTQTTLLAKSSYPIEYDKNYCFKLVTKGSRIQAFIDGNLMAEIQENQLTQGAIALLVNEGRISATRIQIQPA